MLRLPATHQRFLLQTEKRLPLSLHPVPIVNMPRSIRSQLICSMHLSQLRMNVFMTTTELTCMVLPELLLQVLKMVETLIRVPALSHSSLSKTTFLPAGQAKHRLSKRCSVRSRNSICLWNLKNRSIKNGSSRTT